MSRGYRTFPPYQKNEKGQRLCPVCGAAAMSRVLDSSSELIDTGEALRPVSCNACKRWFEETWVPGRPFKVRKIYYWEDEQS